MISIIVPIYNVSLFLSQCLDSILSQTYKDLEIILVDDGSTDNSSIICDEYAEKDVRIKVIHKINGGLSDARNVGVKNAHGEWVFFVDADDWIKDNAIEVLYDFAVEKDCDLVQGNFYYAYHDYLLYRCVTQEEHNMHILDRSESMKELIINDRIKNFAWGKLYRISLIEDFEFPVGKYFEDSFWQHLVVNKIKRYGMVDEPLYYYRQRDGSISSKMSERFDDLIEGYKLRLDFIKQNYPQYYDLMKIQFQKIVELKYPKNDFLSKVNRFVKRVKARVCPSVHYKKISL